MKKTILIGFMIIALLFLAGCNDEGRRDTGPARTPFVGGRNALSMEFVEGAPPIEIFDNAQFPFSINIKIENLGEHDIETTDGYLEITGINPVDFGLSGQADLKQDIPHNIRGVVKNFQGTILVGDTIIAEFSELNYQENIRGNWDGPRIRANLCYNYETEATTYVCLKRDMLANLDSTEICSLNEQKQVYNSGAPIHITKVTQTPLGSDKIQVQFEISHVGSANDRFYKVDTECDDSATNTDRDKVFFEIPTDINGNYAQCSGLEESTGNSGYVKLFSGRPRSVICTFEVGNIEGAFEKQLTATLRYRYHQFIEKRILVKDVSTGN
ncbi:MAG: hypothetical protein ACMXX5_00415 [Candidatus Woesearchaeota archaeon]